MSRDPLFSIVIPTRNRAHLLRYALQSAMEQSFDDYEIIVSDNCSQDNTAEVVQEVGGSRVKYVRPRQVLPMPDHWEFALDHAARGRYVGYLCDDDAWCPTTLQRAADAIASHSSKLVVLCSATYYGLNWFDAANRNIVETPIPLRGGEREISSDDTLKEIFKCRIVLEAPRMLNSFCHRETMLELRRETQKVFLMCPDYSFAAFILSKVPSWIYIDEPLHVQGVFAEGIGSTMYYNRGEPAREFVREFDETKILRRVPMEVPVVTNYIAETLLTCKERMPTKLADYEIDLKEYFLGCWKDISTHEQNGVTVDADRAEFLRVLTQQPKDLQDVVRSVIAPNTTPIADTSLPLPNPMKRLARKAINRSTLLMNLESLVRKREDPVVPIVAPEPVAGRAVFRGEEAGFDNILECAKKLPTLVQNAGQRAEVISRS